MTSLEEPLTPLADGHVTAGEVETALRQVLDRLAEDWNRLDHLPAPHHAAGGGVQGFDDPQDDPFDLGLDLGLVEPGPPEGPPEVDPIEAWTTPGHTGSVPAVLADLVLRGGKRIRPRLCHLGWVAAGGPWEAAESHAGVVRTGVGLELLHVFGLVHDDVMDESETRRGRPAVHAQARDSHAAAGGLGTAGRFGDSLAVLVGDLAHAEAERQMAEAPEPVARAWRDLICELIVGQTRDVVGTAAGRRDLGHAHAVAQAKSGAYTVLRPVELGALWAGAGPATVAALHRWGRHVGRAFALRDDVLGVLGDPRDTGKPSGDDVRARKATVLLALAERRLRGPARDLLTDRGRTELDPDEVALVQRALVDEGVVAEVEDLVAVSVDKAAEALDDPAIDPRARPALTAVAHDLAWRHA